MKKLILILLVLISFQVSAQYDSTRMRQVNSSYGFDFKNLKTTGSNVVPLDTFKLAVKDSGGIAYKDGFLWLWNGHKWIAQAGGVVIDTGSGIDSVTYSSNQLCQWVGGVSTCYRLNKFFDSTSYNFDSTKTIFYNNGVARDSILSGGTDNGAYHTVTQGTDSFTLNRPNGTNDVIAFPKTTIYATSPIYYNYADSSLNLKNDSLPILKYGVVDTSDYTTNTLINKGYLEARIAAFTGGGISRAELQDTAAAIRAAFPTGGGISGGSIIWPGTLYSTPTTGSVSGGNITFSPALASQSAYTLFGRGSGSGTPSFLTSIDSNWVTGLHTENYYNTKYRGIGTAILFDSIFINRSGITANTFPGGIILKNTTATTIGNNAYSPYISLVGSATGSGTTNDFVAGLKVRTFQNTGYGDGEAVFYTSGFNGNFEPLIFTSNGRIKIANGKVEFNSTSPNLTITDNSATLSIIGSNNVATLSLSGGVKLSSNGWISSYKSGSWNATQMTFNDGQFPNIGIGTTTPATSALVEMASTTKGTIPVPKMTKSQRNAITSPSPGLQVMVIGETGGEYLSWYNSSTSGWVKVTSTAD